MIGLDDCNASALRYKNGDAAALEELMTLLDPLVKASVKRQWVQGLPPRINWDDCVQESWCIIASLAQRWEPRGSFTAFAFRSYPGLLRRWIRHDRTISVEHDEIVLKVDRRVGYRDEVDVGSMLSVLPEVQRRAVVLHAIEGARFEEIAPVLGISRAGAHRHYVRGLDTLRQAYG